VDKKKGEREKEREREREYSSTAESGKCGDRRYGYRRYGYRHYGNKELNRHTYITLAVSLH